MDEIKASDPRQEKWHKIKHRLGILRRPLGVFFLILALLFVITPFTPGSMLFLLIGLELLDLRERVYDKLIRRKKRPSAAALGEGDDRI